MKKHSEKILLKVMQIMEEKDLDMIEACVEFCSEFDLDTEEFVKSLDVHMIERLRFAAIQDNKVRKCVAQREATLE